MPASPSPYGRSGHFEPLDAPARARWEKFGQWERPLFPNVVGLRLEEARVDYARMRLPFRSELCQPGGVVHGGAIATLIDTVVVPALAGTFDEPQFMLTIDMQVRYLGTARDTDLIAEGWVVRRGRSVSFCAAEVRREVDGEVVAEGWLVYKLSPQRASNAPSP